MQVKIFINSNPYYSSSATGNRWLTLIEGLNNLGVEVKIFIIGNYKSVEEKRKFQTNTEIDGVKLNYFNSKIVDTIWKKRYYKYISSHFNLVANKRKIYKELNGFEGIVWSENDLMLWKIIASFPNKAFKLISEMSEFLDIHHDNKGNVLQKRLGTVKQQFFEKKYINKLDGLILMTKNLINHYNSFKDVPLLFHLPMTVDLDRFKVRNTPPEEFKSPYIAFVGVMNDAKDGVNILIEAFNKISYNYPSLNLYLVGAWNYDTPSHQSRIKELNQAKRIKWMGEYSRDLIPSIISNAKLLVLPRPDSKQAQGGFPTKLGEYLATGNPVCATSVGEIPDYLEDKKSIYFAEPGSINAFAQVLSFALEEPTEAKEVGLKGKEIAEKYFNKNIQSKKLYHFLERIYYEHKK
ncbi:glycosyltransferase involved in cell wall biosynthesis [Mesonia algae]|uniref:Glycosyltransferase involved in cell wall biosynthesis n=1 Tax=Mesonia algae TaxID=213248 RepID=A0A2W7K875_9FLAO|nr:glycosyltransferase family 4 protein [Mesonia algae]PZW43780.1 glycosyltransferase involved in cell wall biosynthesis [Mesonia algae]